MPCCGQEPANVEMWRASQNISKRVPALGKGHFLQNSRSCASKTVNQGGAGKPTGVKKTAPPPPPPPPPPPRRGGGVFWRLLGLSLTGAAGGVLGFAWYDSDFRKSVESKIPYSKQAFDTVFQYLPQSPGTSKKEEAKSKDAPSNALAIDPEEAKKLSLQRKKQSPAIAEPEKKTTKQIEPAPKLTPAEIEAKKKEEEKRRKEEELRKAEEKKRLEKEAAERKIQEQELEAAAENAALENILEDTLKVAQTTVATAIDLQKQAAVATREHTKQLRQAMDQSGEDVEKQWEAATTAYSAKSDMLAKAEAATEEARQELERVQACITEGKDNKITKKNKSIRSTEQTLNSLNYDLKTAIAENSKAQSEARVMSNYRDLIRKGREQFRQEILSLTPEVPGISSSGGRLTEDELNALIAHAHRRLDQLQRQLAEAQALEALRIEAALEKQCEEDEKLADARVERERDRMRADFSVQKDKWDVEARVALEVELRKELARQAAAHSDHLAEVLRIHERDLKAAFDVVLTERVAEERDGFQREVAGWIARLKGIEAAVEGRAEMEQQARKAQELWLACQMLNNVIRATDTSEDDNDDMLIQIPYEKRMRPLLDEFIAIMDAGNNHPFVNSVLETIPDEAVKRGIWTEQALIDRFYKVRRVCRRTAMIDGDTGSSLFRYMLSHIQSWFVFSAASKPLTEADRVDPGALNTFSLLDNARYYLEQGDLEQALRFMNQLQGEPRRLASDWITEARLLLETRQAADALLAHASANGLGALH